MRIVTWNVNSVNARLPYVVDYLRTEAPDVLCLQELKVTDEAFPREAFEDEGYSAVVHGQKSWNGVAVLARAGAEPVGAGLPGFEDMGARVVTALVDGLTVTSVYVPNGKSIEHDDYPRKLAWLDAFADHVAELTADGAPHVIAGDFNLCPTDRDTFDPAGFAGTIFHTDAERAAYARLVDGGLVDLYRHVHPDGDDFTWWDYRAGRFHKGQGLRIDFLFGTPDVAARVRDVTVDREFRKKRDDVTPSDHAPVVAALDD